MTIREMRKMLGDTQSEFALRYNIPFRTVQNWERGIRTPPPYILSLLEEKVKSDSLNHRQFEIPKYDPDKKRLPKREDYVTGLDWLQEIGKILGEDFVFALDSALMIDGSFLGRNIEWLIYGYGDEKLEKYDGVVLLGKEVSPMDIKEKGGVKFTSFNRTLIDAMKNESILDMQGITEALSYYYYTHKESFEGLYIPPEYQEMFASLSLDAKEYYDS